MAFRDYITCGECETKIIYDGYDDGRNRLEEIWGDPNANSWTVHLLCPDCIKKMRADLAAARARIADHEIACTSLCPHGLDIAAEKENLRRERDALAKVPVWAE